MLQEKRQEAAAAAAAEAEANKPVDSDEEWLDELEADPELERIRQARITSMKAEQDKRKEHLALGHGEYRCVLVSIAAAVAIVSHAVARCREIVEEDFLKEVTGSKQVVMHFYHVDFPRCKIFDKVGPAPAQLSAPAKLLLTCCWS